MNKEEEFVGVKLILDNETYNEYKGTLQEQIEELKQRIDKAIEYMKNPAYKGYLLASMGTHYFKLLEILEKGESNE